MAFGLTRQGFKRKRYLDIRASVEAKWKDAFGQNRNTSELTPDGIIISLMAWALNLNWQKAEAVYNSRSVTTAEGVSLDNVASNLLIMRREATSAEDVVIFYGQEGATVEQDMLIQQSNVIYRTVESATIGESLQAPVTIRAEVAGIEGNAPADRVWTIVTPVFGVDTVENLEPISGGRNEESDADFRERYFLSLAGGQAPTPDGIRAAVLAVEGVRTASVIENTSIDVDDDGRPPKSFETYVLGGEPSDVARAVFSRRAAGIQPWGTEEVTVQDAAGNDVLMRFSYVEEVPIYIEIELETNEAFPTDGEELIRTELIQYIGGDDEDGNQYTGLNAGEDVIYSRLIRIADQMEGVVSVLSLRYGIDPDDLHTDNKLDIQQRQAALTDWEKVTFT